MFYTKYKDWKYEKEYRIIYHDKENKDKFINIHLKIKSIYLGKDASSEAKKTIVKLIKGKGIALCKMKTKEDNLFELECEEIAL